MVGWGQAGDPQKNVTLPLVDDGTCEADIKKADMSFQLHGSERCAGGDPGGDARTQADPIIVVHRQSLAQGQTVGVCSVERENGVLGACAVAVAAHIHGYIGDEVDIDLPGGRLSAAWHGQGSVLLEGPVTHVFDGEWAG